MKKINILVLLLIFTLILSITGIVNAAPAMPGVGKGPPNLEKVTFVHHAKDFPAGNPHGTPPGQDGNKPGGGNKDSEKLWYKYSGLHWGSTPTWYLNDGSADYYNAINSSFLTWLSVSSTFDIGYSGTTPSSPNDEVWDAALGRYTPDKKNVVGLLDLGNNDAIAVTYMWYNTFTKELVDVDTTLNSNSAYQWWQISLGSSDDPDTAAWPYIKDANPPYDVDVQNIMTHEAGHWLILNDLYNKPANTQTMYGISAQFELKKRSLEGGDEAGILAIYPTNP